MTPGVHHLCGNIDMGTARRNVKCSFTPKMECLSCKKPHSTKGPCVLVITDRHGEGITNPDIYREVAGEYPHVLVIHADHLTPIEAGNLLEAMKEGAEGLPRLKGISELGHAAIKIVLFCFTQYYERVTAHRYLLDLQILEEKCTRILTHQLSDPGTSHILHPLYRPKKTKDDLLKYLATTQWMTKRATEKSQNKSVPFGLALNDGPFRVGHHRPSTETDMDIFEGTDYPYRLPNLAGDRAMSSTFYVEGCILPDINRSCWTENSADLTSHGAYQFLNCLLMIGSHWWQMTKEEAEEVHTDVDEDEDGMANLIGIPREETVEGEEGNDEDEGGAPDTGEHQEGADIPEHADPDTGLAGRREDREAGGDDEQQEGEDVYEEGDGEESVHEELLDYEEGEEEHEELRNEPCDDTQAAEVGAELPPSERARTPLEPIVEENIIDID